jgi:hypothetical protein
MRRPRRSYSATPGGASRRRKGVGFGPVPMFRQEPLDQSDILGAQFPALYDHSPSLAETYFLCLPWAGEG